MNTDSPNQAKRDLQARRAKVYKLKKEAHIKGLFKNAKEGKPSTPPRWKSLSTKEKLDLDKTDSSESDNPDDPMGGFGQTVDDVWCKQCDKHIFIIDRIAAVLDDYLEMD